jgi:hypothetical protein
LWDEEKQRMVSFKEYKKMLWEREGVNILEKIWPFLKANDHFCKAGLYVFDDQIPSVIGLIPATKEFIVYESIFKLQEK